MTNGSAGSFTPRRDRVWQTRSGTSVSSRPSSSWRCSPWSLSRWSSRRRLRLDVLAVWSGLILTSLMAVHVLSRTGRLDLAQAIMSASLSIFIVVARTPCDFSVPALCLALLAVPLEAAASGSRRGLFAAGMSMLIGFVVALPDRSGRTHCRCRCSGIIMVAAMVVLAHVSARLLVESKLDGMSSRAGIPLRRSTQNETLNALDDLVTWHDQQRHDPALQWRLDKTSRRACVGHHGSGLFTRILVGDRPAYLKAVSDAAEARHSGRAIRVKTEDDNDGQRIHLGRDARPRRTAERRSRLRGRSP